MRKSLCLSACLCLILTAPAAALEIRQSVWGFDGQVVPHRFNVFSILLDNPTAEPFDGEIRLVKLVGGKPVDAPLVEAVYLAPHSRRWLQFYPYVKHVTMGWESWELSWGKGETNRYAPPDPRVGKSAAVLLEDPDGVAELGGTMAIKRLPDNLFPPHVTATDCLSAVVLDHSPRWDTARQRSFLDWLKRGGRVYLLPALTGRPFEFEGELQGLNATSTRQRVGSGLVIRLERNRRQLDAAFVKQIIEKGLETTPVADSADLLPKPDVPADGQGRTAGGFQFSSMKWDTESALLTHLQKLSNPQHSWALIFLLGLAYLATVFPGSFLVARACAGDFRITFGFLLGMVFLFSVVFLFVGRRGYNEVTIVNSVALARQQPDGAVLDVTQWSNAFVVEGGDYKLVHEGTSRLYSCCQDRERVNREIRNGPDARLLVDMPPFSSRPFLHRAIVSGRPLEVTIVDWSTAPDLATENTTLRDFQATGVRPPARELRRLRLQKGPAFPGPSADLYAVCGRRLYRLTDRGAEIELTEELGLLGSLLRIDNFTEYSDSFRFVPRTSPALPWQEPKPVDILAEMLYPLLARSLEITDQSDADLFVLPEDRIRLYAYAPLPASLHLSNPEIQQQQGFVLYCVDLFEPESR